MKREELNERKRLLELQADHTRWFSQEEFDRLRELSNKMFAEHPLPPAEGAGDDKAGLIKQIKDAEKLLSRKNTPNEVLTKEQFTAIIEDSVKDIWYGRRSMNPVKEQTELLVDKLYPLFDRAAINFSNPKTV